MGFAVESFKEALKRCHGDVEKAFKAAGDKLLMNKFIRQNFGGGRTLKNFRS